MKEIVHVVPKSEIYEFSENVIKVDPENALNENLWEIINFIKQYGARTIYISEALLSQLGSEFLFQLDDLLSLLFIEKSIIVVKICY